MVWKPTPGAGRHTHGSDYARYQCSPPRRAGRSAPASKIRPAPGTRKRHIAYVGLRVCGARTAGHASSYGDALLRAPELSRSATIAHNGEMVIMSTKTVTVRVDTKAAKAFAEASPEEQCKMQLLPSHRLQDLTTTQGKSLQTVMDEIGACAEAHGLAPEILKSLSDDE
jgi:hypothetical protein